MTLDVKNLPCPQPVIKLKQSFESMSVGQSLQIITNSDISKQNLERFLQSCNQDYTISQQDDTYTISFTRSQNACSLSVDTKPQALFIKSLSVGEGELGGMLLVGFISTLAQRKIDKIILVNEAVKLICDESHAAFAPLKALQEQGVMILACQNCLNYFKLEPKIGIISNAYEIVDTLFSSQVVSL